MKVLIVGYGWVGNIFADTCIHAGWQVHATTTSVAKIVAMRQKGIHPYLIDFNDEQEHNPPLPSFFDLILISVSATKKEELTTCLQKFQQLATFLSKTNYSCAVYLSSTGIYPAVHFLIDETNILLEQLDNKLFQVEQLLLAKLKHLNILRLGGIFGYDRIPGKHFSNKICPVANQPANYIHVDDICSIIWQLYQQGITGQLFNAVSPVHPLKKILILEMAKKYNYTPPLDFQDAAQAEKIVSSQKLISQLGYTFHYPDPLDY